MKRPTSVKFAIIFFVIALLGFADATYLTIEHYRDVIPPCTATSGCETVLTSAYSEVLGVPVSLLGALFYLAVLVGTAIFLESKHERSFQFATAITPIGFAASLWFVYLQMFVLHSYCQYCLVSALTSTILFIMMIMYRSRKKLPMIVNQ